MSIKWPEISKSAHVFSKNEQKCALFEPFFTDITDCICRISPFAFRIDNIEKKAAYPSSAVELLRKDEFRQLAQFF